MDQDKHKISKSLKFNYYAIDGSSEAVKKVKKISSLKNKVVVGDFTKKIIFKEFDIIIDEDQ